MESTLKIVDLNFDVLNLIFSQLPKRQDQLNLARADPILCEAFVHHNRRNLFEEMYEFQLPTVEDWKYLLPFCGLNIKSLHTYSCTDQLVALALEFCPNLEFISILSYGFSNIKDNLLKMVTLKGIELNNLSSRQNNIIESLHHLPNLRKLILKNCNLDDLHQLNHLRQLEELEIRLIRADKDPNNEQVKFNLENCDNRGLLHFKRQRQKQIRQREIEAEKFVNICKILSNLRSLSVNGIDFNKETLEELAVHCPLLEKLKLWMHMDFDQSEMPLFPNLQSLKFHT